jgi:hypothetical protein
MDNDLHHGHAPWTSKCTVEVDVEQGHSTVHEHGHGHGHAA